jgi:hypothetical protein
MKKVRQTHYAVLLFAVLATAAFATEQICAPDFEVFGLNADFGKSSIKVLQGKMETQMGSRQLVAPLATDSIAVTDDENRQVNWAKSRGCLYLLQTTLTRLGETVQVNARLMDLNSKSYVFKRSYKANSPDDLHPILVQIGNALQDPKFVATETIYDVTNADAKSLTKKKVSTYYGLNIGFSYFKDFKSLYNLGLRYIWDNRAFIGEAVWNWGFNENSIAEFGLRILYPFSDKDNTFYLGAGAGFAMTSIQKDGYYYDSYSSYGYKDDDYGLLVECAAGYLIGRTSNLVFRVEAHGNGLIQKRTAIGGGLRLILGIE